MAGDAGPSGARATWREQLTLRAGGLFFAVMFGNVAVNVASIGWAGLVEGQIGNLNSQQHWPPRVYAEAAGVLLLGVGILLATAALGIAAVGFGRVRRAWMWFGAVAVLVWLLAAPLALFVGLGRLVAWVDGWLRGA